MSQQPTDSQHDSPTLSSYPAPVQPGGRRVPMTPADETTWSTVGHLSWIAGSVVGLPLLGPLVTYLVLRERGPYVRHHNAQALNFQLSLAIYTLVGSTAGGVLSVITLGLFVPVLLAFVAVVAIAGIVLSILAAVAASRGEWYRYPLTIGFVR